MKLLFLLLIIFQFKHLFADYFLQGEYMLGKFKPDWSFFKPLLAHVGVHAAMTFVIATFCVPIKIAVLLGIGDAVIHFFMDRIKASHKYMGRWKPVTAAEYMQCKTMIVEAEYPLIVKEAKQKLRSNVFFWWALGVDQMVHHLTHYGIIYLIMLFR